MVSFAEFQFARTLREKALEEGIRKALGARNHDILVQFLLEAIFLTIVGGVIGVTLGVFLGYLASIALSQGLGVDWVFTFPWKAMLVGLGVSAVVGLIFGIYPARQAAKKSPMEALRYE